MPRLSIEDSWWTDERRFRLLEKLGSLRLVDGLMLECWRLAQQFWGHGRKKVPSHMFRQINNWQDVIDCDLAYERGAQIYVRGTRQFCEWYAKVLDGSSKGGKSKRKDLKLSGSSSEALAESLTLTLPLTLTKRKNNIYSAEFEILYQSYPRQLGKKLGYRIYQKLSDEEKEKLKIAIENYKKQIEKNKTEEKFIKQFSTFMNNWEDYLEYTPPVDKNKYNPDDWYNPDTKK